MNIEYLIQLLENKMIVLNNSKAQAFLIGDLVSINSIEAEIAGVNDTLYKLRLLLNVSAEVGSLNANLAEAMKMAPKIITDGSTDCLNYFDITSYATDPLHEQKIADILRYMGPMISPDIIDAYIDNEAIASPITGQMILNSAQKYEVDVRLMMAIMELDSRFGTAGVAVDTLNPGNVGNDGVNTKTYPSWEEGVDAVAKWLDRHRIAEEEEIIEEVKEEVKEEVVDEEKEEVIEEQEEVVEEEVVEEEVVEELDEEENTETINTEDNNDVNNQEITEIPLISTIRHKRKRV